MATYLIKTDDDYKVALVRLRQLMNKAKKGTPQGDELQLLMMHLEYFEDIHYPMQIPDAISAIKDRMEHLGLKPRDLIPSIGSRAMVSEILSGKKPLNVDMIKNLHDRFKIPLEALCNTPDTKPLIQEGEVDYQNFPLRAMVNAGWIEEKKPLKKNAENLVKPLIKKAGDIPKAFYRKSDMARVSAKMDGYAIQAWCLYILGKARELPLKGKFKQGVVTLEFLNKVAQFSLVIDGPLKAQKFLAKNGIALIIAKHLPRTYLDGAVMMTKNKLPVIGLTIRFDRIDSFWFSLLHELAHLGRHIDGSEDCVFIDDLTIGVETNSHKDNKDKEAEADEWALDAAIPRNVWEDQIKDKNLGVSDILNLSQQLQIHPALIAGRIRRETGNYRKFSQFVGQGEVRILFNDVFLN